MGAMRKISYLREVICTLGVLFLFLLLWGGAKNTRAATAQITGELTSSVFDSGATSTIFTIMWQGTQPSGTTVKFQLASSNCLNGASNAPTCTTGIGNWSYLGPDGSASTYYNPGAPDTQVRVRQSDHNKRYFRYKIILISDTLGTVGPTVNNIILSWAK